MYKIFDCFNPVTLERRPWLVRVVERDEAYGLNDCLTYKEFDPAVEFHDMARGLDNAQFVSRYYLSTLRGRDGGLCLYGSESAWNVDADSMRKVRAWLREEQE